MTDEKTFVIPEPTAPLTKELNTRMHPLSLAVAKEAGQLDTVASELRASPEFIPKYESSDAVLRSKHAS